MTCLFQWYKIFEIEQLTTIKDKFIQLSEDFETKEFLKNCYAKSERFLLQLFHSLMISILRFFMTNTSVNGFVYLNYELKFFLYEITFKS